MHVVIIWNNVVYLKNYGWKRGEIERIEDAAEQLGQYLLKRTRIRLVYDPDFLSTELEELPKASRGVIARVLAEKHHNDRNDKSAALASETLAWGFQSQWAGGERGFQTFLHTEGHPGLLILRERLEVESKTKIAAAWPFATIALSAKPERARAVVTVIHDGASAYVGGYTHNGGRISQKIRVNDVAELWLQLAETLRSTGVTIGSERNLAARVRIFTTANEGKFEESCPWYAELKKANTVVVNGFDELADVITKLDPSHPSNLLKSLTSEFGLDPILKSFIGIAAAVAVGFGVVMYQDIDKARSQLSSLRAQQRIARMESDKLRMNKQEITNLRLLYGTGVGFNTPGREELLRAIAYAVPSAASATELAISDKGEFTLNGIFWEPGDKATKESVILPIAQAIGKVAGVLVNQTKITFDPRSGKFSIAGAINKE